MRPLKILVWQIHGSYLYYLVQCRQHEFYVPFTPDGQSGYAGCFGHLPWPENVHNVPAEAVRNLELDCILYQLPRQYQEERFKILSESQRRLPYIYLEHDPPQENPTQTRHWVDDPNGFLVHVTPFNQLMWDSGRTPNRVIDHGAIIPKGVRYTGELEKGIVVVNHLARRGRRLGKDIYLKAYEEIPLDLAGMESQLMPGGLGEILLRDLPNFESRYRFFFNPIRYTSLGLAVIEAMMIGMPIVGLATTEMASAIQNGVSGYVDTNLDRVMEFMKELLRNPGEAKKLGEGARRYAQERFSIQRFVRDWDKTFRQVTGHSKPKVMQEAAHD